MDEGQLEGFVAAAERDYRTVVDGYCSILEAEWHWDEAQVRQARADVLAAQQVLELARSEARGAGRRGAQEKEVACPRCGRVVTEGFLFDSAARGEEWCAGCDVGAGVEEGR